MKKKPHHWQIHTKKRNRLEHEKLHDLVYVKYNQKLYERSEQRNTLDPLSLDYLDHCNEWLVGEYDGGEGEGNDMVFDGDSLDWDTVYEASGIGEPITYTRSMSKKRKETSTSSSSRKASRTTSISRKEKGQIGKGKGKARLETVVEQRELVDEESESEDEEVGDEEEGSTSLEPEDPDDDDVDEDEDGYVGGDNDFGEDDD